MLILKDIVKDYVTGDTTVRALKNVNINFRESEFVSILGPSGCGKTTLLNLVGGLDQYTSGDLVINGKSTDSFSDTNWDTYRNHSVGFIFQSYNLIPHQSVVSNVELALTLSGVSKKERRKRAIAALEQVGLKEQIYKKPNQMSGGQMQRVAIARALINNPSILLADEPTGALDSETSVQIMGLLREISKDKLIIMVTHNPELAKEYSNRTIKFLDGVVTDDSNPYFPVAEDFKSEKEKARAEKKKGKKASMSFVTAFSLSLRNLATKKFRTFLTAFAGSIGIIGIALVLALSTGIQDYVDKVQTDALLAYPMSVETESMDVSGLMESLTGMSPLEDVDHDMENVYVNEVFNDLINSFISQGSTNNLETFVKYIEDNQESFDDLCNDIQYGYSTTLNIYASDTSEGLVSVNPSTLMDSFSSSSTMSVTDIQSMLGVSMDAWKQLIGDEDVILSQYDLVYGSLPSEYNEVVLILDSNNEINELVLYGLGIKNQEDFATDILGTLGTGEQIETEEKTVYTYDELMEYSFKLVLDCEYLEKDESTGLWTDMSEDLSYVTSLVENGTDIKIVGIVKPVSDSIIGAAANTGGIGYTSALMDYALTQTENSQVVQEQLEDLTTDVISGYEFNTLTVNDFDIADIDFSLMNYDYLDYTSFLSMSSGMDFDIDLSEIDIMNLDIGELFGFDEMTDFQKKMMEGVLGDEQVLAIKQAYVDSLNALSSYDTTMAILGYSVSPTSISFYPKSFESKDELEEMISYYNAQVTADGHEENAVTVTDLIGVILDSVTSIISIVTYVLIVFVGISLVVSSIMIGIITYISVLERTKEIGILRSIGASKRDIAQVFNAETVTIGLGAGIIGILATLVLEIPINLLLDYWTNTGAAASLPFLSAIILIVISVTLTFIAGLIPSSMAANKDPVEALRTE
ncbi:MAG: ABC transporter ATP-binding protein/permease [Clostridia bacterium]